jgi:hypothetical protein
LKHLGKCKFGRLRRKWENHIKIILREVGCDDQRRMDIVQECPMVGFSIISAGPSGSATIMLVYV